MTASISEPQPFYQGLLDVGRHLSCETVPIDRHWDLESTLRY